MPRNLVSLRVFVASPSDVQSERSRVSRVVHDMNLATSGEHGVQLEVISWETHASPAFGSDPQAVINSQVPSDYDIFVGVLWARVGTPTPRSKSGTLEEYQLAYQRWRADPS